MSVKPRSKVITVLIVLLFLAVGGVFTHSYAGSFNDRSRMAAVESLVHRGTWHIDDSPFGRTGDRILVDNHFYSDKPPVLTFTAAGVYAALHGAFDLTLDADWCDLDQGPCHCRAICDDDPDWAYYLLTLTLVGLPSALMLALFYRMTHLFDLGNGAALLLTGTLGLATQVFPYSTVFNSHLPAAASLLGGFYALLKTREHPADSHWLFLSGLLTALAATLDLGIGLFFIAFLGYAVWRHRRRAWPYLVGAVLPFTLMAVLNVQIVGNPLPPYMYTQGYDYPGSRFPQTIAGNRSPENMLRYGLRLLFGDHGLFAFNPVLLWAVAALVIAWRERTGWLREQAVLVGATSGLFALYFILFTDNFGGAAYGPRWYTVFIPLFFVFVAATWTKMRRKARWVLFAALTAVSLINSYQGALNPWREATPLLRLEYTRSGRQDPVDAALSGIVFEEIEPELREAFATRRVRKRWFDARFCLVVPPGPTWFFLDDGRPLDPALVERLEFPQFGDDDLTCHADMQPAWNTYRDRLTTSVWTSPALVPSNGDPLTSIPLPIGLGNQFAFLGYELLEEGASPGTEIALITAWRVKKKPTPPLSIFVHLLDSQGQVRGQFDGLSANPDGLYPGDILLHVHRFSIGPSASPGRYWLQVGLYNPETLVRLPVADAPSDRLLLTRIDITEQ